MQFSNQMISGPVTLALITRMLTMHALNWLNERRRIQRGAFQPIECVLFALWSLSLLLSLQCDLTLTLCFSSIENYSSIEKFSVWSFQINAEHYLWTNSTWNVYTIYLQNPFLIRHSLHICSLECPSQFPHFSFTVFRVKGSHVKLPSARVFEFQTLQKFLCGLMIKKVL